MVKGRFSPAGSGGHGALRGSPEPSSVVEVQIKCNIKKRWNRTFKSCLVRTSAALVQKGPMRLEKLSSARVHGTGLAHRWSLLVLTRSMMASQQHGAAESTAIVRKHDRSPPAPGGGESSGQPEKRRRRRRVINLGHLTFAQQQRFAEIAE